MSDPAESAAALDLLGDETRVAILAALAAAEGPLSWGALRAALDSPDSARFDYHLQRLVGSFVAHDDDGYRLRYPGARVVRAVRAGRYTRTGAGAYDEPAPGACVDCGASALRLRYDEPLLAVACEACGTVHTENPFPPAALERPAPAVATAFDRLVRHRVAAAVAGTCPECAGPTTGRVGTDHPPEWGYAALPEYTCETCGFRVVPSFGMAVLERPETVAFLAEHGPGDPEAPFWTLPLAVTDRYTTLGGGDPPRVAVDVVRGDAALRAVFDGAEPTAVTREPL